MDYPNKPASSKPGPLPVSGSGKIPIPYQLTTEHVVRVSSQHRAPGPTQPGLTRDVVPCASETRLAAAQFAENVASRLTQFKGLLPACTDTDLANHFVAEQVRALIEERLAPRRLLSGTFRAPGAFGAQTAPPFIDAAIHDPQRGPIPLDQGRFSILDPATCAGVIQVKPSSANLFKFQDRLVEIAWNYFRDRRPGTVMGVVALDADPERKSDVWRRGKRFPAYQFTHPKWCPVFVLFSRRSGTYDPHFPAIEALLANLSRLA